MAEKLTISQLNKLGERLRKDPDNKDALRLLETFRLSFTPAYDRVFGQLRELGTGPCRETGEIDPVHHCQTGQITYAVIEDAGHRWMSG